jgi:hypothetical protein
LKRNYKNNIMTMNIKGRQARVQKTSGHENEHGTKVNKSVQAQRPKDTGAKNK